MSFLKNLFKKKLVKGLFGKIIKGAVGVGLKFVPGGGVATKILSKVTKSKGLLGKVGKFLN